MTTLGVVVPAHHEEELLPRCLDHLLRARHHLAETEPEVRVRLVVAVDGSGDRTAAVAASYEGVEVVEVETGSVGAARAAGADLLLTGPDPVDWVAGTDADTLVPEHWLTWHLAALRAGYHLLLGTVWPEGTALSGSDRVTWLGRHQLSDGHPHIHGANLGVSAAAYRTVGGFRALSLHEDVDLSDRVRAAGFAWLASGGGRVVTSDRLTGRVRGGFADYLLELRSGTV